VILAGVALVRLRAGLLATELSVALVVSAVSFIAWLHLQGAWPREAVFVAVAVLLLAGAAYGRRVTTRWARGWLRFSSHPTPEGEGNYQCWQRAAGSVTLQT